MAIKYTKRTEIFCRFKGEELKAVMEKQNLTAYMLAKAIGVYPAKVRGWENSKYVTVDLGLMAAINSAIDCTTIKKIL